MKLSDLFKMRQVGTPENPEILEPGEATSPPRQPRLPMVAGILKVMLMGCVPALLCGTVMSFLVHTGLEDGAILAWVLVVLLAPFTFVSVLLAFGALLVGVVSLRTLGRGRPVVFQFGNMGHGGLWRDVRDMRPRPQEGPRDVTPDRRELN